MMKYKAGALGVMLAGFLLFPVTAQAAQEEVELQVNGSQAEVIIRLPESQTDMITSMQLGFTVHVTNGTDNTRIEFEFSEEVDSVIQEYRYQAEQGTLNLYVSGTSDLFDAENNELKLGTISLKNGSENTNAELTVRPESFKLVNKANRKIEDAETFENFIPVTIGETEEDPGTGIYYDTTRLSQAVEKAVQTDLSLYADGEIKEAFVQKLREAKALLEAPTSQEAVDQMTAELENAMEELETVRIDEEGSENENPDNSNGENSGNENSGNTNGENEVPDNSTGEENGSQNSGNSSGGNAGENNNNGSTGNQTPVPTPSGGSGSTNGTQGGLTNTTVNNGTAGSAGNSSAVSKSETVKTGDSSRIGVWAGVFVSGIMMLSLLFSAKRKKRTNRK